MLQVCPPILISQWRPWMPNGRKLNIFLQNIKVKCLIYKKKYIAHTRVRLGWIYFTDLSLIASMNLLSDFKVTPIVNIDFFFHSKSLPIRTQAHCKSRYIFPPLAQKDPFFFPTFFLYLFQVAVLFIDPLHADISNFNLLRDFQLS